MSNVNTMVVVLMVLVVLVLVLGAVVLVRVMRPDSGVRLRGPLGVKMEAWRGSGPARGCRRR
jgi:hypothetical protein